MALKTSQPAEEQESPYLPPGIMLQVMEQFEGVNTSSVRAGIPDAQCKWIDGFIPLSERNLRTLYSNGVALYTPGGGKTIICFYFANLGAVPIAVVFLSDGSVVQVNLNTNAATTILTAATIGSPSITLVGVSQWGQQYVIIVANQPNGYWLWDGTFAYQSGTLSPVITLTDPGNSYQTVPNVIISGGNGTGATAVASIAGGFVTNVVLTNPGSGYLVGDTVTVTFVGGTSGGSGAMLTAVLTHNAGGSGASLTVTTSVVVGASIKISSITVVSGGTGYSQYTTVTPLISGGVWAITPILVPIIVAGVITSVTVVNGGQTGPSGGTITAVVTDGGNYVVTSATVGAGGSGYSPSTTISASGGGSPAAQATLKPILTGGVVTSVVVLQGGNYGSNTPPTLTVTDMPEDAAATVELMPFGIQGSAVETYSQRVWVINGPHLYFTAPGSFSDFSTSNGGGNQTSGDSTLRVGYARLLNTNGFLFLIGDSSVNYISGVQTSGTPPTTTFTYQNADPQVGSPYPCSVQAFGRSVMLANAIGVYEGSGGSFTKISDDLDGIYNTVASFGGVQISAAQAIIFNRKIFMELVRIVDPVSGSTVNKLLMWNGRKWFASDQDVTLIFINSNEINSILTAYGTDGSSLYALFTMASATLQKTVQSKYWDNPGYMAVKATNRFFGLAKYYDATSPNLTLTVDAVTVDATGATVENASTYTITGPSGAGYFIVPPEAVGQQGVLTGFTIKTMCKDVALISTATANVNAGYRG